MSKELIGSAQSAADVDRGADDSSRLPVVAWQVEFPLGNGAKVYEQRPSWAYESYGDLAYVTHELCRLTDTQALLAEKDARIAELERQATMDGGLARLALNAAKDQLASAEAALDKAQALNVELRAKLQAAPAERGAPDETAMARALCNYHADLCGVNRDDQRNMFSEDFLNDVAVMLAAAQPLPAAPATADSDAREVK